MTTESVPVDSLTERDHSDIFNTSLKNEVYFATGNDHYDLYVGYSMLPGPQIQLLSRDYIDPNSIQVAIDIKADYSVYVFEQEMGASLTSYEIIESEGYRTAYVISADAYDLPLYLYQTYAGINWVEVGNKYLEYLDLWKKYEAKEVEHDQVTDALGRYNYTATEYINEYSLLTADDIPRFYAYKIQIFIDAAEVEEVFTAVQITVDDTVYDVNIGEVYIRPYSEKSTGHNYLSLQRSSPTWLSSYPYGVGIEKCRSAIYHAETGLTLTGLRFLENTTSNVQVLDVTAVIADDVDSASLGNGIEIEWDGVTPIYIEQGKFVTLIITIQDNRMKEINYHSKLYPIWEFECDNSVYEIISEIPLYRYYTDKWLLYAIGMDGLDMESYFNDYYYLSPAENWRNDVDLTPWGQ